MASQQQSKRGKRPDNRPARARYWQKKTLKNRKIRHIMANNPHLSRREATDLWEDSRRGRMKR